MFASRILVALVVISSGLASSTRLEKRQLRFGNCNTGITKNQDRFEAVEEPLKNAVQPSNDGNAFLQSLCNALPNVCGTLKQDDVNKCNSQAQSAIASSQKPGANLVDEWNKLGNRGGRRGGKGRKNKGGRRGDGTRQNGTPTP